VYRTFGRLLHTSASVIAGQDRPNSLRFHFSVYSNPALVCSNKDHLPTPPKSTSNSTYFLGVPLMVQSPTSLYTPLLFFNRPENCKIWMSHCIPKENLLISRVVLCRLIVSDAVQLQPENSLLAHQNPLKYSPLLPSNFEIAAHCRITKWLHLEKIPSEWYGSIIH